MTAQLAFCDQLELFNQETDLPELFTDAVVDIIQATFEN